MADRYPVGVLKDELGNPVGLREFPDGDTLPKSILPPLVAEDVGADPAGSASSAQAYAIQRENHTGAQPISTVEGLPEALDGRVLDDDPRLSDSRTPTGGAGGVLSGQYPNPDFAVPMATAEQMDDKVDKVIGKGLSTNDITDQLYDKLVGLEGTHWRGTFVSLAALDAGVTDPQAGDYADVDVAGEDVQRYIWDATDNEWVVLSGAVAPVTAAQVKQLYESNSDTNAFTDADEAKLEGIASEATKNRADSENADRVHTHDVDQVDGLDTALESKVDKTNIVQESGQSTTAIMSQKAVTDLLADAGGSGGSGDTGTSSLQASVKVTVGVGGDFPTINAAILHLSRFTPDLGVTAEVELMSGFMMKEQLIVEGLDLGWITITGVDAETVVNSASLTRHIAADLDWDDTPAFGVINGTLPTIGQLFIFGGEFAGVYNLKTGVMALSLGRANILPGCGVKEAWTCFSAAEGSTINAHGAIARDSPAFAFNAYAGSTINAMGADASGALSYGFSVYQGGFIFAAGATGSLSQTKNTVTANGIIFQ